MAPLPTIAGIARIAVDFEQFEGVKPVCTFHVATDSTDVTEIGAAIEAAADSALYLVMPGGFNPSTLTITLLDGTAGGVQVPIDVDWCSAGSEMVPEAACVISQYDGGRGPRHRNRQFVGPVGEANMSNGTISPANVSTLQDAWNTFAANLLSGSPEILPAVVSYVHAEANQTTSIKVKSAQATQRRRLLQTRS
jgi:hypothetical protein